MVRTGDIIRTLSGWTAIGRGKVPTRGSIVVAQQERTAATERGVHAMSEAINDISVDCSPADARRVLCLMTAPSPMINVQMFKEIGDSLRRTSRDAMIMSGDYPRDERTLEIVIILSEIVNLPRVVGYVDRAVDYIIAQKRRKGIKNMPRTSDEIIAELPLLF
jgi:cell division GTPase FtsZ